MQVLSGCGVIRSFDYKEGGRMSEWVPNNQFRTQIFPSIHGVSLADLTEAEALAAWDIVNTREGWVKDGKYTLALYRTGVCKKYAGGAFIDPQSTIPYSVMWNKDEAI